MTELPENEEVSQYGSVLENALDPVVGMDADGLITHWNPQAEKTFGWLRAEVRGKRLSEVIIPERYREAHDLGLRRYFETGVGPILNQRIEVTAIHRSGAEIPVELSITPVRTATGGVHFYSFLREISERKQTEDQRQALFQSLQSALIARDEFISIASHELKTPLTSLRLQFQMAEKQLKTGDARVYSPESVEKRIRITGRQIDRMVHLIDGMLDVSRIAAGKLQIAVSKVNLSEVVLELVERFSVQWDLAKCPLTVEIESDVFVSCDVYRMEQVVSNLITNTIKYAAGSPVQISLKKSGKCAHFSIHDGGAGIPFEDQERIFGRFERATPASSVSGLGLGLYITRQILESHGGRISVQSKVGEGSTFTFDLPALSG